MTLKEVLSRSGYQYPSVFTARAIDIEFESTEELCFSLGYILKHAQRIDAEIPEGRSDILGKICPNYPITDSYTSGGYDMKWGAQYRIYFDSLKKMPQELYDRVQFDEHNRLSGSAFVESLLYIGFDPGNYQNKQCIIAAVEEIFPDPNDRRAFEDGYNA